MWSADETLLTGRIRVGLLQEEPVSVQCCPPHIPYGLVQDRTQTSTVGGRRLVLSAMEGPEDLNFPEIMLLLIHSKCFAATQTFYKITDSQNIQAMDLKVPLKDTLKN